MKGSFLLRKFFVDEEVRKYFRDNTLYIVKMAEKQWKFSQLYKEEFKHKEGFVIYHRLLDWYSEFVVADNIDMMILYYCRKGGLTFNLKAEVLKIYDKSRNLELFIHTSSLPVILRERKDDPGYEYFI